MNITRGRRAIFAVAALAAGAISCRGDDISVPDVFVDYDAHGVLPDGITIDSGAPDAIDAAPDATDGAGDVTVDASGEP